MKILKLLLVGSVPFKSVALGASLQVSLATNTTVLKDFNNIPLTPGSSIDSDGAILQIGYYTLSTSADPFLGDWVPMTGPGTSFVTTVGDSGNQSAGQFKFGVLFDVGGYSFVAPQVGTPLALRFYDSASIASSNYFNAVAVTSGAFVWVAPSDPKSTTSLSFLTSGIVWQGGVGTASRTTIVIPEPSTSVMLVLFGLGAFCVRRRLG